jgi:hypothetical protein
MRPRYLSVYESWYGEETAQKQRIVEAKVLLLESWFSRTCD